MTGSDLYDKKYYIGRVIGVLFICLSVNRWSWNPENSRVKFRLTQPIMDNKNIFYEGIIKSLFQTYI